MTAAEKRVQELLERWLASIELHAQYLKLDDAAYARAQDWPKHQRPTKWVVDLARKRLLELQGHLARQQEAGNTAFAESLELMSFLTSLLASEHIDRFIPLATGKPADSSASGTVVRPRLKTNPDRTVADKSVDAKPGTDKKAVADKDSSAVRKGLARQSAAPKAAAPATTRPAAAPTVANKLVAAPRNGTAGNARVASTPPPAQAAAPPLSAAQQQVVKLVLADAARFLEWGTEWPALAAKIAHLAGRPPEAEVRSILRAHRDTIQQRARRAID